MIPCKVTVGASVRCRRSRFFYKPFRGASPALGQGNGKGMGDHATKGGDA